MANMKCAFGMIHVLALLMHLCTVATMNILGADEFAIADVSESVTATALSVSDTLLSPITSSTSVSNWAPSATVTASTSLTYSTRPAASGFWTGTDPFSFVTPTYLSSTRSLLSSIDKSSYAPSLSTTSSLSANASSTSTGSSSTSIVTTIEASLTTTPVVSVSVSTHTSVITTGPVHTTASTEITHTTTDETQTSASTLTAGGIQVSPGPWFGWTLLALAHGLF